jgi:hypothetical protein
VQKESLITQTQIGEGGMLSYWGEANYFYFSKDYGFEVRQGNYIFKVNNSGLRKSSNGGSNWTNL